LRPGLGFDFRISDGFALHPEVTYLRTLKSADENWSSIFEFGVGFNFGSLPKYGSSNEAPAK